MAQRGTLSCVDHVFSWPLSLGSIDYCNFPLALFQTNTDDEDMQSRFLDGVVGVSRVWHLPTWHTQLRTYHFPVLLWPRSRVTY